MMKIEYLNHASVLIEIGEIRLLTDPWFFGTCFQEGWGLRYDNDKAIEKAKTATHLWVSHFHSDHFHVPTLKKILEINPEIIVLGNDSYNFQLNNAMKGIGFKNVIPLLERKEINLNDQVKIKRYPTTGIDNMLLIQSPYGNILNYNDCNLPPFAQKKISKKVQSIDVFLTNFNHAGKLLVYPKRKNDEIKKRLKDSFKDNFSLFDVKYVFPFASYHYYKAPESFDQNFSMLDGKELLEIDDRVLDIKIGDTLHYDKKNDTIKVEKEEVGINEMNQLIRGESIDFEKIEIAAKAYCKSLRKNYGIFCRLLPTFYIQIKDSNLLLNLNSQKGFEKVSAKANIEPHIQVHSEPLYNWLNSEYGTDSFVVGAHFEIAHNNKIPLKWQIVFGLLIDNKLSVKSIFKMLFSISGIRFLINRREEILGILLERKINADYHD